MSDYRRRIYELYVHGRQQSLAPESIDGLKPRSPFLKKLIRDHFPLQKDAIVVDLGCGHGALVHFARLAGYSNVTGVDRSSQQVAEARRLGIPGISEGDLMETLSSFSDECLDVVIAFDVIEHFRKDEVFAFADEVYRILRKNGRWIIHAPNGESPFVGRVRYGDFTHELAFTRDSMTQVLKSSGFSNVTFYEDCPIPHGVKSAVRWGLWKLIRGIMRIYLAAETGVVKNEFIFTQNFLTVTVK